MMAVAAPIRRDRESTTTTPRRTGSADSLRLGGHVSLGPRPIDVMRRMRAEGFTCLQIHASSPRTWRVPATQEARNLVIRNARVETGMDMYLHSVYLLNLASENEDLYTASIRHLIWNMRTAADIGARAVVFHIGSHLGRGFDQARPRIEDGLATMLRSAPPDVMLFIENSAGGGGCVGADIEEIGVILQGLGYPKSLGMCLDTAHAFAAGYDIRSAEQVEELLTTIDRSMGMARLRLIHLNDSKVDLGSGRDRHENIGGGYIGLAGFANILTRPEVRRLPLILETPRQERRLEELALLARAAALAETVPHDVLPIPSWRHEEPVSAENA